LPSLDVLRSRICLNLTIVLIRSGARESGDRGHSRTSFGLTPASYQRRMRAPVIDNI
jgi:hypothetical protein